MISTLLALELLKLPQPDDLIEKAEAVVKQHKDINTEEDFMALVGVLNTTFPEENPVYVDLEKLETQLVKCETITVDEDDFV